MARIDTCPHCNSQFSESQSIHNRCPNCGMIPAIGRFVGDNVYLLDGHFHAECKPHSWAPEGTSVGFSFVKNEHIEIAIPDPEHLNVVSGIMVDEHPPQSAEELIRRLIENGVMYRVGYYRAPR